MDVMNQVLVLFLLILCGFTAVKAGWIREGGIQASTRWCCISRCPA